MIQFFILFHSRLCVFTLNCACTRFSFSFFFYNVVFSNLYMNCKVLGIFTKVFRDVCKEKERERECQSLMGSSILFIKLIRRWTVCIYCTNVSRKAFEINAIVCDLECPLWFLSEMSDDKCVSLN